MSEGREAEPRRIVVATRSRHKLAEIRQLLADLPLEPVSLVDLEVAPRQEERGIEVHDTFAANARAKAEYFRRRTGLPTLADDSGLCVDALDGGPGVRTKRFAPDRDARRYGRDEANNRHLLMRLAGVAPADRGACYRCAAALEADAGSALAEGKVCGRIAGEPRGEGGFGYDPLFHLPEKGGTFAELGPEVKRELSHRARAIGRLRRALEEFAAG